MNSSENTTKDETITRSYFDKRFDQVLAILEFHSKLIADNNTQLVKMHQSINDIYDKLGGVIDYTKGR